MKVLHVTYDDRRGAGLCAYRLLKAQQSIGINARMLALESSHRNDKDISAPYNYYNILYRIMHKLLRRLHIYIFEYDKLARQSEIYNGVYTSPARNLDIIWHPWVKEADIIHLHWVDNFFNQPQFFKYINKPVVWTIHDEGLFYGTSHYHDSILKNDELEIKYRKIKLNMIKQSDSIYFVLLSKYFKKKFGSDMILRGKNVNIINNSVDCTKFTKYNKNEMRNKLKLENDKEYFIFIAADISDVHKGLNNLIQAIVAFNSKNMRIIAIGGNKNFKKHPIVLDVGKIYDPQKLSEYLSAADYFVMPSLQEAFSQAPIEAMACGLPAIVTPVSGTEELITKYNGIICEGFRTKDIKEGIKKAQHNNYDSDFIRNDVLNRFSPKKIANEYLLLYNNILKTK